jgi:hypothetical protein
MTDAPKKPKKTRMSPTKMAELTQDYRTVSAEVVNLGGRPTDYHESYPDLLVQHMAKGFSFETFAGLVGCCTDTLYEWKKKHDKFSDAHKIGMAKNKLYWEDIGIQGMTNKIPFFNSFIWFVNMKNRHDWVDNKPPQIAPKDESSE